MTSIIFGNLLEKTFNKVIDGFVLESNSLFKPILFTKLKPIRSINSIT